MSDKVESLISALPQKMLKPLLILAVTGLCSLTLIVGTYAYTWAGEREQKEDALASELKMTREQVAALTGAVNQLTQIEQERAAETRDNRREMREFRTLLIETIKGKEVR